MNIDAMPAGREMDYMIARLMGWEYDIGRQGYQHIDGEGFYPYDVRNPLGWLPHYSTDIADAWEVAEKFSLHISLWAQDEIPNNWIARDRNDLNDPKCLTGFGLAPLAICRAALEIASKKGELQHILAAMDRENRASPQFQMGDVLELRYNKVLNISPGCWEIVRIKAEDGEPILSDSILGLRQLLGGYWGDYIEQPHHVIKQVLMRHLRAIWE